MRELRPDLGLTVSATTRAPREGEVDGVAYHFLSDDEFTRRVEAGDFLEWANVHDHRYGTLFDEVSSRLGNGQSLILEVDVRGALNVKDAHPEAILVFIEPPSMEVLEQRLAGRGTESAAALATRLANARKEMSLASRYDAVIVNDDLAAATSELLDTIERYENEQGAPTDVCDQA